MYSPKGFEVLSISLDAKKENWVKAIGEDGMTWKHGSDLLGKQSPILGQYMVNTIPYTLLLDHENRIVAKNLRGNDLKKKIAEMLKN